MNETTKNNVLASLARLLDENRAAIIDANRLDVEACSPNDAVILDRLKVDEKKVDSMIASVRSVADAPDHSMTLISQYTRSDGLRIENRRVPFGTILIVYEARPDVSIEAAIIALKAGNRILLKGGKEARHTNLCLAGIWQKALEANGVDSDFVRYLDLSREETRELIAGNTHKFDLVIPRGGNALIDFVLKNSRVPVLISGRGNNFLYIDAAADLEMAIAIAVNGKQRLSVCNALDKILVNKDLPEIELATGRLVKALIDNGIQLWGDEEVCRIDPTVQPVEGEDMWYEEFLAAKMVIGVVPDADAAIAAINQYSGGHSAAIVTANAETAERFMMEVDCAAVYHNASTRFTDGGEFGLGAEIAISTQKLHFRGPLGAEHLLTNKWFVFGNGQTRK